MSRPYRRLIEETFAPDPMRRIGELVAEDLGCPHGITLTKVKAGTIKAHALLEDYIVVQHGDNPDVHLKVKADSLLTEEGRDVMVKWARVVCRLKGDAHDLQRIVDDPGMASVMRVTEGQIARVFGIDPALLNGRP